MPRAEELDLGLQKWMMDGFFPKPSLSLQAHNRAKLLLFSGLAGWLAGWLAGYAGQEVLH
jgi:hypothetical protein